MDNYCGSMYYLAPGGTAVLVINPGNASVPGRSSEHASAAELDVTRGKYILIATSSMSQSCQRSP